MTTTKLSSPGTDQSPSVKSRKRSRASPFEIVGQIVQPGERTQIDLPASNLYTHTPLNLPVEVIHGRSPGPTMLICAAIHGDELNGVEIIRRMRSFGSLKHLHGTLVLVPVVNQFGFIHQSRYLPDRRDLNRCFPGSEQGSIASRVANIFFTQIVSRCTHIIDLHTAAVNRDNLPQVRAALDEPGVREMAEGFSIPVIINSGLIENSLRCEAGKLGIPIITYEAGEALRLNERSIVTGVRGIVSVMRILGMLPSKRIKTVRAEPYIANSSSWFRASMDGIFRPLVKLGSRIKVGDTLGVISAPFSSEETVLTAAFDGIIICVSNMPLVNEGEALFHIARFDKAGAVEEEIAAHESNIEEDRLYDIETVPVTVND
ncbi:MAG: succinylglutamate desuccinylase/aspartoacylase family protein [Gammaproteobacteria bacterium]|nr:succinylglutamate desuccinylase/aspartoacylase family protein [Gammaproteobacteria bacterium]